MVRNPRNKRWFTQGFLILVGGLVLSVIFFVTTKEPEKTGSFVDSLGLPANGVTKTEFEKSVTFIAGSVVSLGKDGTTFKVRGEVVDTNEPNINLENPATAPSKEIEVTIAITPETKFIKKQAENLSIGGKVRVYTKESIYKKDVVDAIHIEVGDPELASLVIGDPYFLEGVIVNVDERGKRVKVTSQVVDVTALKQMDLSGDYSVPYAIKEYRVSLQGKETPTLTVGDYVRIKTTNNIYVYDEVVASSVIKLSNQGM